eukprot:COSAG06_NODE_5587_length_3382_cov_1.369479_1_plen_1042_part_01
MTGTRQLLRANVDDPACRWTPLGSRLPTVTAMSTSDTRLIITCSDLSVRILETAMLGDSPTQELYWQPFGTTALNAERGIAAYEQAIYVAGPDGIHVGEFTMMGALDWKSKLSLPPNAPKAPPPPAEILCEIDGCVGCGVDSEPDKMLICSSCEAEWHLFCLKPPLSAPPKGAWRCSACSVKLDSSKLHPVKRHMHAAWEAVRENKAKKKKHCRAQPFLQLPSYTEYPDYYTTISNPMSLAMVKRRAAEGKYKDWNSFAEAMDLVFANARQYNHPDSAVVSDANKLQRIFDSFKRNVPDAAGAAAGKGSKRPREDELSPTTYGQEGGDERKLKKERAQKKKRSSSEMEGGSPSRYRTITIVESGPLGVKFKEGSLMIETAKEDYVGHQAGIRSGMRLVAFQGEAVSDYPSAMTKIKATSRPWELTFKVKQPVPRSSESPPAAAAAAAAAAGPAAAAAAPSASTQPRLMLSAPTTDESTSGKRKEKKVKKAKKEKKEKRARFEMDEDEHRHSDSHVAPVEEQQQQQQQQQQQPPLLLQQTQDRKERKEASPRATEWVTVALPPDVEPGEPFAVDTGTRERQVVFPKGGRRGDNWKFELDTLSGRVVSHVQLALTDAEKDQRKSESEDVARENQRFQIEMRVLEAEQKKTKPKGRMSAFWNFCGAQRAEALADHPELGGRVVDQSKLLSEMWKKLPKAQQQPYYEQSERDSARHKVEHQAWKTKCDQEKRALTSQHEANLEELIDRHERQRRGEIVDEDPRSNWSLQSQFDLTSTADIDAHLDRSSLTRCSVGDALAMYTHLRSMETVYGTSAFLLQDFLCGLAAGRENKLLSEIHLVLLKVLNIEQVNNALADDSGDSDHFLLNWFSGNYHTWPELLRQTCEHFATMPLDALSIYLSPTAGHVPPEGKDDAELRGRDQSLRLRAAREVKEEAQVVVDSLSNDEYWFLPPMKKIAIMRFIVDILIHRGDTKDLTQRRIADIESRIEVERDDWTGKSPECAICGDGGEILCCDFCSCSYHLACIRPEMKEEPPEDQKWFCQFCTI